MGAAFPFIAEGLAGVAATAAQAESDRAMMDFERRSLQQHARQIDRARLDRERQGQTAELRELAGARRMIGAQRAAMAAQGLDLAGGSAAQLQQQTRVQGGADAATLRINAFREALGLRLEREEALGRARVLSRASRGLRRTTLATGGLQFARTLSRLQDKGLL